MLVKSSKKLGGKKSEKSEKKEKKISKSEQRRIEMQQQQAEQAQKEAEEKALQERRAAAAARAAASPKNYTFNGIVIKSKITDVEHMGRPYKKFELVNGEHHMITPEDFNKKVK